jgi:Predicted metal-dependent hydrolase of the TIM-barrel fold
MTTDGRYRDDIINMKPIEAFIFDCHCHIGPLGIMYVSGDGSAEDLIRMMDIAGIDKIAASHMLALSGDATEGNRLGHEAASKYKGRIYQYLAYDPNLNQKVMLENICSYIDQPATIGIKLHPMWHGTVPDDTRYSPVMELASERGMPVLVHTWGSAEVLAAEIIAKKYPSCSLLVGHSGGADYRAIKEAIRAAVENRNIFLDLTLSLTFDGLVEYMLSKVPVEKILFGSDMSYMDPRSLIGRLAFAAISDRDKERIFGGNFLDLVRDEV